MLPVYTQFEQPEGSPIIPSVSTPPYERLTETGDQWLPRFITWIEDHVKLKASPVPTCTLSNTVRNVTNIHSNSYINEPTGDKVLNYKVALWCMWQRAKEKVGTRHMACLGRDAWFFEICARIEGYENNSFHPEISTNVSGILKNINHPYKDAVMVDTGYRGTVAKNMGVGNYLLMTCWTLGDQLTRQLIQSVEMNVEGIAGIIEGSPKLWSCAAHSKPVGLPEPTRIVQDFVRNQDSFDQGISTTKFFADVLLNPEVARLGQAQLLKFAERKAMLDKKEKKA